MKIVTLVENEAQSEKFDCARGLSYYVETSHHKILIDAGPDDAFYRNAETLGIDLSEVDIAVLTHGHSDHAGGLPLFFQKNQKAKLYLAESALLGYTVLGPAGEAYIGVSEEVLAKKDRFCFVEGSLQLDDEITIFPAEGSFPTMDTTDRLMVKKQGDLIPDLFQHELDVLLSEGEKQVLICGCGHRGIINILKTAEAIGQRPVDACFGGFHLFQLEETEESHKLLCMIGKELEKTRTVFYSAHCTGSYAVSVLEPFCSGRLMEQHSGAEILI